MTSTLQTTVVQLLNRTIEQVTALDPNGELDLTDTERANMNQDAIWRYTLKAAAVLAPYGCFMLGNGDIIRAAIDEDVIDWDEETIREGLSMIDISEVLDVYLAEGEAATD